MKLFDWLFKKPPKPSVEEMVEMLERANKEGNAEEVQRKIAKAYGLNPNDFEPKKTKVRYMEDKAFKQAWRATREESEAYDEDMTDEEFNELKWGDYYIASGQLYHRGSGDQVRPNSQRPKKG